MNLQESKIYEDIKIAVKELNLVLSGKLEARDADDLLTDLQHDDLDTKNCKPPTVN